MGLAAGARIGAYEVTAAIGAGGMGEVFASVTPLFPLDTYGLGHLNRSAYAVPSDGRFLVTVPRERGFQDAVTVVVNWPALVEQ